MLYAEGNITGKGFVTHEDRENNLNPVQYANIIVVEDTAAGAAWLTRNSLTSINKATAQASYDTFMDNIIDNWVDNDMLPVIKPTKETLP
tara:strand:+ start:344 stop:613 length:270 start_codon:yes stop_codon:yes gene_type:complete